MSILQYLDQEYLRIQDHLTARVEDLPNLDLETIQNKDALINALVGQNKAYGNHIISLYKTIDATKPLRSPKSSAKSSTDRSNMDLITELQNKVKSYQGVIEDLSNKNLVLLTQVEQLTEHINFKEMKSDHRNVSLTSFSYNGNKFFNSGRVETNQTQQTQRDLSIDVEFLFNNEDFKRATELLTLMDYKQPTNVSTENFNELLIISNKIKDAEMNELLEKLRIVAEAIEIQDQDIRPDESVNISPIDRLFTYIEQKLIKIWSLDQNPGNEELKKSILNSERRLMSFNTKRRQASLTLETEGDYLCPEQLRERVKLLDRDLRQTELELQERTDRLEELEAKLNRENGKEECLLNDLENEVKNRLLLEEKIQEFANENEELKEAFEGVEKENKELNHRVNALHDEIQNKNDDLNRLIEEREQLEQESVNMGDFEKLREEFLERGDKIEVLTNEIALLKELNKNYQEEKRPSKNGEERGGGIRCPKESLMVESALNMQETLLCNLKHVLISLKEYLVDTLRNTDDIVLSERIETVDESLDGSNVKNEIRRFIKFNNSSIQNLLKQAYFIKSAAEYILQHSKEKKNNGLKGLVDTLTIKPFTEGEQESNNEPEVIEPSNPFRMQLRKDQREISNKLKHAMQSLEDENDFGSKFGSPIEIRNLFDTEDDQKSTFLYEIVALVNRGINKTNDAVSKIKKLADSKDAKALLNNISSQLEDLQTQVNDFANLQGLESTMKNAKPSDKILTQEKFVFQPQKENVEEQPKQRPSQRRLNINTGQENGFGLGGKIVSQGFLTPSNRLNFVQSAVTSPEKQQLGAKLLGSPAPVPLNEKNNNVSQNQKKDDLQRRIQYLEIENKDLKEYKISSEAALKKTHKKLERLNLNFSTEVNVLQEEREKLMLNLEERQEEVAALAQRVNLLQSLSNEQLSMIQIKDQELAELQDEKRDNQELVRELQVKLSEQVKDMKECSESSTQRIDEMNSLQIELAEMTVKCNQLEGEIKDLEKKNKEIMCMSKISTENQEKMTNNKSEMEDKIKKLNELLQITRNELKTCRRLVEEKNQEISQKEGDIKALKDALKKGRNINKESDIVIHLKNELHAQNDEISTLKHENSDLLQMNDLLQNELEKVSNMNRSSVISKRDYRPPVNTIRDGSEELLTLQKSLKMREEPQKLERNTSQKEVVCSKRRGSAITVDTKNHENDSRRGSTVYNDLLHTTGGTFVSPNNISSQTSRSTMRDEREAEIQKLTNRMNELTKTLKTTQTTHHNTYPSFRFINSEQS